LKLEDSERRSHRSLILLKLLPPLLKLLLTMPLRWILLFEEGKKQRRNERTNDTCERNVRRK
jgi:hypothetical protein